jgi:hypothetical protein
MYVHLLLLSLFLSCKTMCVCVQWLGLRDQDITVIYTSKEIDNLGNTSITIASYDFLDKMKEQLGKQASSSWLAPFSESHWLVFSSDTLTMMIICSGEALSHGCVR